MSSLRTCRKCGQTFKNRCPRCRKRGSSGRPASRRQHAQNIERLIQINTRPAGPARPIVTTAMVVRRRLARQGLSLAQLGDIEYARLLAGARAAADRWERLFGQGQPA